MPACSFRLPPARDQRPLPPVYTAVARPPARTRRSAKSAARPTAAPQHTYENGICTVCGAAEGGGEDDGGNQPTPDNYADGAPVSGGGATIPEGSFALTETVYDESKAEETKSNTFFRTAVRGPGKVFRISDGKALTISATSNQTYDGEGSILIAPNGVVIENSRKLTLKNLVIVGEVTIRGSEEVSLEQVGIIHTETALTIDSTSSQVFLNNCRLTGKTALTLAASNSVVLHSYLAFTERGVVDTASEGTTVRNCVLEGAGEAIRTSSSESTFRSNTITLGKTDTGIVVDGKVLNVLVALNDITGAQDSIVIGNGKNISVVLNRGISVTVENNSNLYIVDNSLGGRITAKDNNYFIADGNTFPADGFDHTTVQSGSKNHNGNNLMDVNARPEVGADEALLPHVDKDLFIGMERKEIVDDVTDEEKMKIAYYILAHCKTDDYVIIAPGAYKTDSGMAFRKEHGDTTIYAYGVYMERQADLPQMMNFQNTKNITVKGMTIGFKQQSCGQVYVLEKLGSGQVRVVTGAGMMNEFGNTNKAYYNTTGMGAQRMGTFYAYCDTSFKRILSKNNTIDGVDTMIMEVSDSVYKMLAVGDILTCRANNGSRTIALQSGSRDIVFYDLNLYGNAGGFAFIEERVANAVTYYRVADTTQNGVIIDEETYNLYKALGERYGVDLEIEIDDLGRFRGSPAHIGSIDATHAVKSAVGSQATFCLFENMCDDATNQGHSQARIHEVVDNGDGTTTLFYKPMLSTYSVSEANSTTPSTLCNDFKVGDRVYVYSPVGQLVCDTAALTATSSAGSITVDMGYDGLSGGKKTLALYKVTVRTEDVNFDALIGIDLKSNHHINDNKVRIDNMSQASNGFLFDNCKFQNIRSRGLLIKASDGAIKNCTFRNIGMSCAAILFETYYAESGITENMVVDRNLFDHTGYFKNQDLYATVSVFGLGASVQEDYLLYKNIQITNNHIMRRTTDYAIYINSAKDVVIKGNTFGAFVGNNFTNHPEEPDTYENPRPVIHINGAMNVEISDNVYPNPDILGIDYVVAERNKNIFGTDVTMDGQLLIPDSET